MAKQVKTKIDDALFSKLKQVEKPVDTLRSPIQKIVPVTGSKRDNEAQILLWIPKQLKKALQLQALAEDTNLKEIFVSAATAWCRERGIEWEKE